MQKQSEAGASPPKQLQGFALQVLTYLLALLVAAYVVNTLTWDSLLLEVLAADVAATVMVWALARLFNNSSLYDPYWSVAPVAIAFYVWAQYDWGGNLVRNALILGLVNLWGWRLTWNFLRGWPGLHHQDWRYDQLTQQTGRLYPGVELSGIVLFPTLLVFGGCLPLFYALPRETPLNPLDMLAAVVTLYAIYLETTADNQLRAFRHRKKQPDEVLTTGLWAHSRHPNYLGELTFWWGLWLFGLAATPNALWTVIGPLSITLLFVFISVPLIDKRHLERRGKAYEAVMQDTPALFPNPFRKSR